MLSTRWRGMQHLVVPFQIVFACDCYVCDPVGRRVAGGAAPTLASEAS